MYFDSLFKVFNDQRLIFAVTLLLSAVLAYQLSILVWKIVPQPEMQAVSDQTMDRKQSQSSQARLSSRQKTAQIAGAYLFGRADQPQTQTPAQVQDAPKSTLNYKLRGIYFSDDKSLASVILQKNAKDSKFYRLGDEVDHKIFVEMIHTNHIIISRNGRLEKLVLEKPTTKLSAKQSRSRNLNASSAPADRVLKNYRRRYKDNPMALAKRFQAIPVQENGKNIGYKLRALRGEQLLRKLNLQKDDVFMEINGIGLDKPFQALDALKSLTTAKSVALTVMRNGNRETIDFTLD